MTLQSDPLRALRREPRSVTVQPTWTNFEGGSWIYELPHSTNGYYLVTSRTVSHFGGSSMTRDDLVAVVRGMKRIAERRHPGTGKPLNQED